MGTILKISKSMKKTSSILFIALFLFAGHRASAQGGTSCGILYNEAMSYGNNRLWQMEYDTAMMYVDSCPYDQTGPSQAAFGLMTQACQQLGPTPDREAAYLAWLESVLYLNTTDPGYFCACVVAISGAIPLPIDTTAGAGSRATNYPLSVISL
jgi:hypothetical protein